MYTRPRATATPRFTFPQHREVQLQDATARHHDNRRAPDILVLRHGDRRAHHAIAADRGVRQTAVHKQTADDGFVWVVDFRKLINQLHHLRVERP